MAAAIEHGSWLPPQLVTIPAPRPQAQPHAISPAILDTLRPMMRAVVTTGTAAGVGFPPGVYGKTGTAQYGNGPNPPSHGWFIGYRGDVAFAVLVEGGALGADSAGPIAMLFCATCNQSLPCLVTKACSVRHRSRWPDARPPARPNTGAQWTCFTRISHCALL